MRFWCRQLPRARSKHRRRLDLHCWMNRGAVAMAPTNIRDGKEKAMKPDMFRQPVFILVGLGFPAEVRNVLEAYRHLSEWPATNRDSAHSIALKACAAALRGE